MRRCNAESHKKRSAKGSNFKEDNSFLPTVQFKDDIQKCHRLKN